MLRRSYWLAVVALVASTGPCTISAQANSRVTFDLVLGGGSGSGGDYYRRGGFALDGTLGFGLREGPTSRAIVGLSLAVQGPVGGADECPTVATCTDFPLFVSLGVLGGWETGRSDGPRIRVMGGPSFLSADEGRSAAITGRLDVASAPVARMALVGSVKGSVLPRLHGDALALWSVGLGLRVQ